MSVRARLLTTTMLSGVLGASFLAPLTVSAADLYTKAPFAPNLAALGPAVDGVNSKFGGLGGSLANRSFYQGQGSVSIPLAGQWGFQLDREDAGVKERLF